MAGSHSTHLDTLLEEMKTTSGAWGTVLDPVAPAQKSSGTSSRKLMAKGRSSTLFSFESSLIISTFRVLWQVPRGVESGFHAIPENGKWGACAARSALCGHWNGPGAYRFCCSRYLAPHLRKLQPSFTQSLLLSYCMDSGVRENYDIDTMHELLVETRKLLHDKFGGIHQPRAPLSTQERVALKVIVDHARASSFLLGASLRST